MCKESLQHKLMPMFQDHCSNSAQAVAGNIKLQMTDFVENVGHLEKKSDYDFFHLCDRKWGFGVLVVVVVAATAAAAVEQIVM